MRDVLRLPLQRLPAFLQHRKLRQQQLALFFQILLQRRLVGKALQQRPSIILGKRGDFRIDGVDTRAQLVDARLQRIAVGERLARGSKHPALQLPTPSPRGQFPNVSAVIAWELLEVNRQAGRDCLNRFSMRHCARGRGVLRNRAGCAGDYFLNTTISDFAADQFLQAGW